jgi:hypothetical protein
MSPNPRQSTQGGALNFHRAICELVLEADDADADEIIRSLGESPSKLEIQAREAWTAALSENTENVIQLSDHRSPKSTPQPSPVQRGFSSLMRLLRRRKEMEIPELALCAQIDPAELSRIEEEPGYLPAPRTIFQLERFFDLPKDTLSRLSGAVTKTSDTIQGELLRFAACSDGIGKLTKDEKNLLNEFVKHLARRK